MLIVVNLIALATATRECREKLDYGYGFSLKNPARCETELPVSVDGFELQCQSMPKCCSELEVAEKVHLQAENVRYQVRQQANSTTMIIGETRVIFNTMLAKAVKETVQQVEQGYPKADLIVPLVKQFFDSLGRMLSNNRYNQIVAELEFDNFVVQLTRKYVEQIEKADVELSRECIDRIKHKDVTFTKERVSRTEIPIGSQESSPLSALKHGSIIVWNQMSGTWIIYSITNNLIRKSFQPIQLILWTIEQLRAFQYELQVDDFLPTAKCVAPLLYCAPCENKKQLIDSGMCFRHFNDGDGQTCFSWLDKWSETIDELQTDIDAYRREEQYNIQIIFDQLPGELVSTIQKVLTEMGPAAVATIQQGDECKRVEGDVNQQFRRHKRLAPLEPNDFTANLNKVIASAHQMKKAVINSVCASLNTDGTISDAQATHVLPPMTKVLGDDIIEDKLNHIQSQLRRKRDDSGSETKRDHHRHHHHQQRKHEVAEDYEGSGPDGGCDDEDLCGVPDHVDDVSQTSHGKNIRISTQQSAAMAISTLSLGLLIVSLL